MNKIKNNSQEKFAFNVIYFKTICPCDFYKRKYRNGSRCTSHTYCYFIFEQHESLTSFVFEEKRTDCVCRCRDSLCFSKQKTYFASSAFNYSSNFCFLSTLLNNARSRISYTQHSNDLSLYSQFLCCGRPKNLN